MYKTEEEKKIEREVHCIELKIHDLHDKLYEKKPSHWHFRDIVNSFMGSLILGLTFIFKGSLVSISLTLANLHLTYIIIVTSILLTFEIYYIAYSRVGPKERKTRHFGQFWAKRFFTLYGIAFFVSLMLIYLFNMDSLAGSFYNVMKIVISVSMPCALGAAIPSLLKQY